MLRRSASLTFLPLRALVLLARFWSDTRRAGPDRFLFLQATCAMTVVIVVCFSAAVALVIVALVQQMRQRRALQAILRRVLRSRKEEDP